MPVLYVRHIYVMLGMDLGLNPFPDYGKCIQLADVIPHWLFSSIPMRMDNRKTYPAKGKRWTRI